MFVFEGRRWFSRKNGNTYHSVRIFLDDKELAYIPYEYGYDSAYIDTAMKWARENYYWSPGDKYRVTVVDVARKRDL